MDYTHVAHPFAPVFDRSSRVLVLGSLPSVRSRENKFYYGHPQNRFWRVLAAVFSQSVPQTVEEKTALLLLHGVALWDVVARCDIAGSSDSSIRNAEPTDLRGILESSPIERIFANGGTAAKLYDRLQKPLTGIPIETLPSTSPANAAWTLPRLCEAWSVICTAKPPR
ncbi:MAG: DNA-deoxyinosine glycosylase [Clostridia bacterium]|nr:DNA-deoxyinosine glycosylase [Clostridia bacterium]